MARNQPIGITIWPNSGGILLSLPQFAWGSGDVADEGTLMSSAARKMDDFGTESFADELPVGTQLLQGQFTIESFLNAGGFGITYVARDSLNRQVVIKECFPSSFCRRSGKRVGARSQQRQDDFRSMVALFMQEAINLSKLDHPNIVRVHQVFQDNDTAYMAMDYVRGPDLLETVEGTAPRLAPARITMLLGRMLDALGHVHAKGFLHRDISPDNILLDSGTGEPVLIDFGAARKDETRKSRALSGLRVVKDGYSPQEFYISGSLQAPCSDLYALGASFSHLITGEAPKTSRERLSAIANRQSDPERPLLGRVKGYSDGFLAAIDKAMAIFPRDRLQSVGDWQAMLGDAARQELAPSRPERADPDRQAPALVAVAQPLPPNRDKLVRAAAFVLLLAGLASLAGQIYDRFFAPGRGASLLVDEPWFAGDFAAVPGNRFARETLAVGPFGTAAPGRALTGLSVTAQSGLAPDLSALSVGSPDAGLVAGVKAGAALPLTLSLTPARIEAGSKYGLQGNGLPGERHSATPAYALAGQTGGPGIGHAESPVLAGLSVLGTPWIGQARTLWGDLPEDEVNNTVAT